MIVSTGRLTSVSVDSTTYWPVWAPVFQSSSGPRWETREQVSLALKTLAASSETSQSFGFIAGGKLLQLKSGTLEATSHPAAEPVLWPLGHEVRPAARSLGAKGCEECGDTGYKGRAGLYELLVGTDEIKTLIQKKALMEDIKAQAIKDGMKTLYQDGIIKVLKGLTDMGRVQAVCMK